MTLAEFCRDCASKTRELFDKIKEAERASKFIKIARGDKDLPADSSWIDQDARQGARRCLGLLFQRSRLQELDLVSHGKKEKGN